MQVWPQYEAQILQPRNKRLSMAVAKLHRKVKKQMLLMWLPRLARVHSRSKDRVVLAAASVYSSLRERTRITLCRRYSVARATSKRT